MKNIFLNCLTGALLVIICTACIQGKKMGTALVTEIAGQPCFAIPKNSETLRGVPLFTLIVTKKNAPDDRLWYFRIKPLGNSIVIQPENCISFGATPKFAEQETIAPLQPFQVYIVDIQAVPENTNLLGYQAEFCLKPAEDGKLHVQVVPWDETAGKWRYDVCVNPKSS